MQILLRFPMTLEFRQSFAQPPRQTVGACADPPQVKTNSEENHDGFDAGLRVDVKVHHQTWKIVYVPFFGPEKGSPRVNAENR